MQNHICSGRTWSQLSAVQGALRACLRWIFTATLEAAPVIVRLPWVGTQAQPGRRAEAGPAELESSEGCRARCCSLMF